MFASHPKFNELKSKGCAEDSLTELATSVYVNLCEKHQWWDVELHFSEKLKCPFVTGKPKKNAECKTVIPCSVHQDLTINKISKYFELLEKNASQRLTFALCEADLTVVYYEILGGIQSAECSVEEMSVRNKNESSPVEDI